MISSTSLNVNAASITVAPSLSVNASVPPAPPTTGLSSSTAATVIVEVTAVELLVPSLTT